jgi:hypothetical protein
MDLLAEVESPLALLHLRELLLRLTYADLLSILMGLLAELTCRLIGPALLLYLGVELHPRFVEGGALRAQPLLLSRQARV